MTVDADLRLRNLGLVDYRESLRAMQEFTAARTPRSGDEIWLVQHAPVYTMGLKGRNGTRTNVHGIPLVYTDRGGDMTYHGPGQIIAYVLMDLRRRNLGPKNLVQALEQTIIELLATRAIHGQRRPGAPGVYVDGQKIAALGLRVRHGASYHGIALNVDMDLAPFSHIDPCGFPGQPVTQLADLGVRAGIDSIAETLSEQLIHRLGYTAPVLSLNSDVSPRIKIHG